MSSSGMEPIELDLYADSESRLRALKATMPTDHVAELAREVIARVARHEPGTTEIDHPPADEIDDLCCALISKDSTAAARFIEAVRADGASDEAVYLTYLAVAARQLGVWWDTSEVSFADVTVGTSRIFAIMRAMRRLFVPRVSDPRKLAVFATVPGETHTLGVNMAADLFRQDGWEIELKTGRSHEELIDEIAHSDAKAIGLSISGDHSIPALSKLVIALRICKPMAIILVAGQSIEDMEDTLDLIGVDAVASDIHDAKAKALAMVHA